MRFLAIAILASVVASAEVVKQAGSNGAALSGPSVTVTGTSTSCLKAGSDGLTLNADCANKRVGIGTTAPVKQVELGGANAYIGSTAGGANTSGQNLSVVAGIGQGVGQTAGHLYLGSGRGNSSATSGNIYLGLSQSTDVPGLASTIMTVDGPNARVGIGTTNPAFPLDVSAAAGQGRFTSATGTNSSYLIFANTGGNMYVGSDSSVGGVIVTGNPAYAATVKAGAGRSLTLATDVVGLTVAPTTGNISIGGAFQAGVAASSFTVNAGIISSAVYPQDGSVVCWGAGKQLGHCTVLAGVICTTCVVP